MHPFFQLYNNFFCCRKSQPYTWMQVLILQKISHISHLCDMKNLDRTTQFAVTDLFLKNILKLPLLLKNDIVIAVTAIRIEIYNFFIV